jgi:hypothetical protein
MGANLGELRTDVNGNVYKLCQAGTTVNSKSWLQLDQVSLSAGYIVEPAYASASPIVGINATGGGVASTGYFWALVRGTATVGIAQYGTDATIASNCFLYLNSDLRAAAYLTAAAGTNAAIVAQNGNQSINSGASGTTGYVYIMGVI